LKEEEERRRRTRHWGGGPPFARAPSPTPLVLSSSKPRREKKPFVTIEVLHH